MSTITHHPVHGATKSMANVTKKRYRAEDRTRPNYIFLWGKRGIVNCACGFVHLLEVWHVGEVEASQTQADGDAAEHEQVVSPRVLLPVGQTVPVRYPVLKQID